MTGICHLSSVGRAADWKSACLEFNSPRWQYGNSLCSKELAHCLLKIRKNRVKAPIQQWEKKMRKHLFSLKELIWLRIITCTGGKTACSTLNLPTKQAYRQSRRIPGIFFWLASVAGLPSSNSDNTQPEAAFVPMMTASALFQLVSE